MRELGDVGLVCHQHDGVAARMQLVKQRHDLITGLRVQVARWLVSEDDRGAIDECARNGNALALSAGELVRLMVHALFQIHRAESRFGAFDALCRRGTVVDQRQLHVVQRSGARQQVEGLEDEADLTVADARQLIVVQVADAMSVQCVGALAWRIQAADQVHQRRLAGARRTHDGDVLVVLDAQADAAQRVHLLLGAHVIRLPQVFDDDDIAPGL